MRYAVPATFSFTGTFYVEADNAQEARATAQSRFFLSIGRQISTDTDDREAAWEFPCHADLTTGRPRRSIAQEPSGVAG
jgi:hypothetical protein